MARERPCRTESRLPIMSSMTACARLPPLARLVQQRGRVAGRLAAMADGDVARAGHDSLMRQELAAVPSAYPLFSDEESVATGDGDGPGPRTALPSASAVEEDSEEQGGEEQGDGGDDAAQDSADQEEQAGETADGAHGKRESEQGPVEDCGGPGAQEGTAAAVSKDGCGQLAHKAGLAAPDQAGLAALQLQTKFGATETESV